MKTLFVAALMVVSVPSASARQVASRSDRLPISRVVRRYHSIGGLTRTSLLFVLFASVSAPLLAQEPRPPVRVYVWTAKVGIEESVSGLIGTLDDKWLVATPKDTSEIQVEITRFEVPGFVTTGTQRGAIARIPIITVYAALRFNDSSTELVCTIGDQTPTWISNAHAPTLKDAGAVCAKKTKAWVKANLKTLRPDGTPKE